MKKRFTSMVAGALAAMLASASVSCLPANVFAESIHVTDVTPTSSDPFIMVSMGDSYSSGEGNEPFYGQYDSKGKKRAITDKINDYDWLAHRSEKSWPGKLVVPGIAGTMKDYKKDPSTGSSDSIQWYFVASSGAVTADIEHEQGKTIINSKVNKKQPTERSLPAQLDVFNHIDGSKVDYVTLTIGGNDVYFSKIIADAASNSNAVDKDSPLDQRLKTLWDNIETTKANIKSVYESIHRKAPNATILVAGYPKLLDRTGRGILINEYEAQTINSNVTRFNNEINSLVESCKSEMDIHFVDVEGEFDSGEGHGASAKDPWINRIYINAKGEDLDQTDHSCYSMHPNESGTDAYARCVNAKIQELEENSNAKKGTLTGKICKADDRQTPVSSANISVFKDGQIFRKFTADSQGNYSIKIPAGYYSVQITAAGYVDFKSYATVTENTETYMETFLLVSGSNKEKGKAEGYVFDALTGANLSSVKLEFREGWNNLTEGKVIKSAKTGLAGGNYSVKLPYGNYTAVVTKSGYITTSFNIIVKKGTTANQNCTMSPKNASGSYRIVLTWGATPSDLDSHVYGKNSSGTPFHVYYNTKNQSENGKLICGLDVDDTTSYGPETITLNTNTKQPYYYYIYNYSGEGAMATSGAQIKVYQGSTLIRTYNVPTNQANSRYWNVFAIKNGKIIDRNTITSSAETGYAN